jgi:formate hydrogenlyase transcriptional activator
LNCRESCRSGGKRALQSEKERLRALVEVNRTLVSSLEMRRVLPLISDCVTRVVPHDFAGLTLFDPANKIMRAYVLAPTQDQTLVDAGRVVPMDRTLSAPVFVAERPTVFTADDLAKSQTPIASRVLHAGIRTVLSVPLRTPKGPLGTLNVGSRKEAACSEEDQELMNQVAAQLAIALENARAYEEIESLKRRLEEEKHYLEGEIRTELHFEEIVGESRGLKRVLAQAKTVAQAVPRCCCIGETGTGKELIARGAPYERSRQCELHQGQLCCHPYRPAGE